MSYNYNYASYLTQTIYEYLRLALNNRTEYQNRINLIHQFFVSSGLNPNDPNLTVPEPLFAGLMSTIASSYNPDRPGTTAEIARFNEFLYRFDYILAPLSTGAFLGEPVIVISAFKIEK